MLIINGITITTPDQLEEVISTMSDQEKTLLRNDFYGIPNTPTNSVQSVTPRQMRIALVMSGVDLNLIENMINNLPEPSKTITRVTWEYSVEFQRNNPLLIAMAPALGLTNEQIDQLFQLASTL